MRKSSNVWAVTIAGALALTACGGGAEPDSEGAAPSSVESAADPAPDSSASTMTTRKPANDAEVVAAIAFQPPWVEVDPREDGPRGWVQNIENFPSDAGFEVPTDAQIGDVEARGLLSTRNRQFTIEGPDPESGTDDSYASIYVADFGTAEQAAAAVDFSAAAALARPDGALDDASGIEGVRLVSWSYSIQQCTPDGAGGFDCPDEPPWATYHVLLSVDRFTVLIHMQWADGTDQGPDEALKLAEFLLGNFGD